ncbi:hypothetical protein [Rhodococcus pyridinivorans]|uniref:hypothetical protein n=1 Tax=Rhodococcus pyridinivorans TaxID=103816 RepID=UPI003AADE514
MAWKKAVLVYELGAGGRHISQTCEVEMSEVIGAEIRVRNGGLVRFRHGGTTAHVNADRIITIDIVPESAPDEAIRAADGE